jgi:hypothetical protein
VARANKVATRRKAGKPGKGARSQAGASRKSGGAPELPAAEPGAPMPAVRDPDKLRQLACKLHQDGRGDEALAAYQAYLLVRPGDATIWSNLGVLLRTRDKLEAAAQCYRKALELQPGDVSYLGNLGNVLKDLDDIEGSLTAHRAAVAAQPDDVRLLYNLGLAYREAARYQDALGVINRAIAMQARDPNAPADPHKRWDRALALLHLGRYREGWLDYEARWFIGEIKRPAYRQPIWDGKPLDGKTILIYPEQGFGDTILASRFLPQVKAKGATVILECKPPLRRLFTGLAGVDRLAELNETRVGFDCHCSLMGLLGRLDVTTETIAPPPRLTVPQSARDKAKRWLSPAGNRFKVGIVWSGSTTFKGNRKRATSLDRFLDLAALPGVQLYSLYKGPLEPELKEAGAEPLIVDLGSRVEDLADSAAVVEQLDLVLMTDSAVAHLAGSLGRPVWNLLCYAPYWLYGPTGDTTPWYPSMRLIRQPVPGDWDSVFARVKTDLAAAAAKQAGTWPPAADG